MSLDWEEGERERKITEREAAMQGISVKWIDHSVRSVLSDMEQGKLALPEFQRGWRWSSTGVRDYVDSLGVPEPTRKQR